MTMLEETALKIERRFPVPVETVFRYITEETNLLKWWGPEGIHIAGHSLDFTRTGPWHSVMVNADGKQLLHSVTRVQPVSQKLIQPLAFHEFSRFQRQQAKTVTC